MSLVDLLKLPSWRPSRQQVTSTDQLRSLIDAHHDFIGRSLRRLGVQEADLDDACQQVFLVVSRNLENIQTDRERGYLFGIAVRVAADARRSRKRRSAVMDEQTREIDTIAQTGSPETLLQEQQNRVLLDELLDTMSTELRTIFVLFELEEMSMAEISQTLDLPPGTVASRLRRAREVFHEQSRKLRSIHERQTL